MPTLNLLESDLCLRLTITLVHFLWQGIVIALALGVMGLCLRRASANSRYVAGVAALVITVVCLPVTFALVSTPPSDSADEVDELAAPLIVESPDVPEELPLTDALPVADLASMEIEPTAGDAVASESTQPPTDSLIEQKAEQEAEVTSQFFPLPLRPIAPYATSLYLLGVSAMLLRLVVAVWGGQRLRLVSTPVTDESLLAMIRRAARRVSAKVAPAVAYCQRVSVPVVVGIVKPVILLPASLASGMLPDQLETVLTHELAHIRRYDPLVNLLQRIVEAAFFFHPAVWYVSRRVNVERENCCDDLVLSAGWKPVEYAEALVRLGELCCVENGAGRLDGTAVVAASGGSPSRFKRRVLRLLGVNDQPRLRLTRGGIAVVTLLATSLFVTPWIMQTLAENAEPASSLPEVGGETHEVADVAPEKETSAVDVNQFRDLLRDFDVIGNKGSGNPPPSDLKLQGRVLGADGKPVPGARVFLAEDWWRREPYLAEMDVTDADGRFVVATSQAPRTLAVAAGNVKWAVELKSGTSEFTARLPKLVEVTFRVPEAIQLDRDELSITGRRLDSGNGYPFGCRRVKVPADRRVQLRLPPGFFSIGHRKPKFGDVELDEIEVKGDGKQSFTIGRREGCRIHGRITGLAETLAKLHAQAARVTVSAAKIHSPFDSRTFAMVFCDEQGRFDVGPIPHGPCVIRVQGVYRGVIDPSHRRENPWILTHRVTAAGDAIELDLPTERERETTVEAVHRLLDWEPLVYPGWAPLEPFFSLSHHPDREGVVAELVRLLNDDRTPWNWRNTAISTLSALRPVTDQTHSELVKAIDNPVNHAWRPTIIAWLDRLGPEAVAVIDKLAEFKDDPHWRVRYAVVDVYGDISRELGKPHPTMERTWVAALDDQDGRVREKAAGWLGHHRCLAGLLKLRANLNDSYAPARAKTAWAVSAIANDADATVGAMIEILRGNDYAGRLEAAHYLQHFDDRAQAALPALRENTNFDKEPPFRNGEGTLRYRIKMAALKAIETIEAAVTEEAKRTTRDKEDDGAAEKPDGDRVGRGGPVAVQLATSPEAPWSMHIGFPGESSGPPPGFSSEPPGADNSVFGRVVDTEGRGVPKAVIEIYLWREPHDARGAKKRFREIVEKSTTDDSGRFTTGLFITPDGHNRHLRARVSAEGFLTGDELELGKDARPTLPAGTLVLERHKPIRTADPEQPSTERHDRSHGQAARDRDRSPRHLGTSPHQEPVEIDAESQRDTSDLGRLQGVWKIVVEERPDKKLEGRDDLGWILFSGDRFLLQSASGRRLQAKFMLLHPPTRLKKINLIAGSGDRTHEVRGIYSFVDDTLKLCLPSESGLDRPTEFAAGGESYATLVTLRRTNAGLLFVNRGRVIEPNVGAPIKSVWVPDTSVLEVAPLDAKRIRITTKKVGGTVLTIVDQNDNKTQMDIIVVERDDLNFDTPAPVVRERNASDVPPAESEEPSGEEPSDWHRGPEGLQYRVRLEKAAWHEGEVPILFVDLRNRGKRDDVAIETHQTQQRVHVGDVVYERRGQSWAGLKRLSPGGEHLTIPFTLCDWTAVSNPLELLEFHAGKQDLRVAIHIAIKPEMSIGEDGVPVYTVPNLRAKPFEMLTAPFQIEILPSDHKTPKLDVVRENIRRELIAFPRFHTPKVPQTLHRLVRDHVPDSGDYLLKVLESGDDSLHWPAGVTFADSWDQMTHEQVKRYLQLSLNHTVDQREQYPHGIDAAIRMGVGYDLDYRCVPPDRKYESHSVTTHFLDGEQYGEPFSYPKYSACTGWIKTKDLELGKHLIHLVTDYEFTRGESTWKGRIESSEYEFEIVSADVPDHLAAPPDAEIERIVRESFKIAETSEGLKSEAQIRREQSRLPVGLPPDPWRPQIRWTKKKDGQFTGLHLPVWKVTRPLPVDLCFKVELHIKDTDVVVPTGDLVLLMGEHGGSYIGIHRGPSIDTLLKHRDENGFVPVRVLLKPSRAAALTSPKVTCYFNHEITSHNLRVKLTGGSGKKTEAEAGHDE